VASPNNNPITIRDIERIAEMREVECLQKEVWQCNDRDIAPYTILAATREVGAILVGAFDQSSLVGFAFSLMGREQECLVQHSHMLAVKPSYRNLDLGYKLKLAQRDRALAQGINRMTWTFDPLQSLNAYFNFAKLGVTADAYNINFYGEATSSVLHQIGTDRLWVTWQLDSDHVKGRIHIDNLGSAAIPDHEEIGCLVRVRPDHTPEPAQSVNKASREYLSIEIPGDINALQIQQPELAADWREATRRAFTEAISAGYKIEDFHRTNRNGHSVGAYLLRFQYAAHTFD
jgi:predicted GNAT superfamily acetyltransferase